MSNGRMLIAEPIVRAVTTVKGSTSPVPSSVLRPDIARRPVDDGSALLPFCAR
jgi:hypothetical protein